MPVFVLCFLSQSYDLEFWSMTVIDFVCTRVEKEVGWDPEEEEEVGWDLWGLGKLTGNIVAPGRVQWADAGVGD